MSRPDKLAQLAVLSTPGARVLVSMGLRTSGPEQSAWDVLSLTRGEAAGWCARHGLTNQDTADVLASVDVYDRLMLGAH